MTSFRLDSYRAGKVVSSEMVDGLDNDELAMKLVVTDCTSGHCKLYRNDVLIAEMDKGLWYLPNAPREVQKRRRALHELDGCDRRICLRTSASAPSADRRDKAITDPQRSGRSECFVESENIVTPGSKGFGAW